MCSKSHLKIVQYVVGSRSGKKKLIGLTIKYRIELAKRTNDRHLNSHWRSIIEAWQANIDIQLIVDSVKVVQYTTKYVTKSEPSNEQALEMQW